MEDLDHFIKKIRENIYENELADIYIVELFGRGKEYD